MNLELLYTLTLTHQEACALKVLLGSPTKDTGLSTEESARKKRAAVKIADALMTNGQGETASRLQLRGPHEEDLGGYCRSMVLMLIDEVLSK